MSNSSPFSLYYLAVILVGILAVLLLTWPFVHRPQGSRLVALFRPRITPAGAAVVVFNQRVFELSPQSRPNSSEATAWIEALYGQRLLTEDVAHFFRRNQAHFMLESTDGLPRLKVREGAKIE